MNLYNLTIGYTNIIFRYFNSGLPRKMHTFPKLEGQVVDG